MRSARRRGFNCSRPRSRARTTASQHLFLVIAVWLWWACRCGLEPVLGPGGAAQSRTSAPSRPLAAGRVGSERRGPKTERGVWDAVEG